MFYWDDGREIQKTVKEAIITPDRIAIDWGEGEHLGHLEATSTDRCHFSGHYGYPVIYDIYRCEFTLYKAEEEVLLYGTWYETNRGWEGKWLFTLTPTATMEP